MEICCEVNRMVRHPDLRQRFDADQPRLEVIEALRAIGEPMTVAVVFGFWCPDSLRIVPQVLKAVVEADNENLQVLAASVPLEETHDLPIRVGPISVRRFPTVALLRGKYERSEEIPEGAEVLRFVEEPLDAARLKLG